MRLHSVLVEAVATTLTEIFQHDRYADKAIQYTLKSNKKWGSRDRSFIAESVYSIVRWYRLYYEILGHQPESRMDWYRIFGIYWILSGESLPSWEEFDGLSPKKILAKKEQIKDLPITASIPDWLHQLGEEELTTSWPDTIDALNQQAEVVLRVNRLKISRKDLQKALDKEQIATIPIGKDGLKLERRTNVFQTEAFKKGYFEVQDAASQEVAAFADVAPGMRVVDTCAGAGGKTLHLASLMDNKGQLIALDTLQWKLGELKKRAKRAGAHNIQSKTIDKSAVYKRLYGTADRVLIDAPCSGLGVIRRNPDSKWKLKPEFLVSIKQTQADLLDRYSKITKPKGMMIYVTCSILPSENQDQVKSFLERNTDFELVEEKTLLPQDFGYDGFYMAKLRKI